MDEQLDVVLLSLLELETDVGVLSSDCELVVLLDDSDTDDEDETDVAEVLSLELVDVLVVLVLALLVLLELLSDVADELDVLVLELLLVDVLELVPLSELDELDEVDGVLLLELVVLELLVCELDVETVRLLVLVSEVLVVLLLLRLMLVEDDDESPLLWLDTVLELELVVLVSVVLDELVVSESELDELTLEADVLDDESEIETELAELLEKSAKLMPALLPLFLLVAAVASIVVPVLLASCTSRYATENADCASSVYCVPSVTERRNTEPISPSMSNPSSVSVMLAVMSSHTLLAYA